MRPEAPKSDAIAGFYDQFSERLLTCFVEGNPRIDAAVDYAVNQIPSTAKSVLEIGCGIGETTQRIRRARRDLLATGIDISPQNIATAEQLFGGESGLRFYVSDMTVPVEGGPFDTVTLLDVYEHIPTAARPTFHRNLRSAMSATGRLILTCPSFLHQRHLREHNPAGLQIVDETIGTAELLALATDLGGELTHFEYSSVWRTNDYFHATIDLNMQYVSLPKPQGVKRVLGKLQRKVESTLIGSKASRRRLVETKLPRRAA